MELGIPRTLNVHHRFEQDCNQRPRLSGRRFFSGLIWALGFFGIALTPALAAPFAYVANSGSNTVSVIDIPTNTVVATVPVGTTPYYVAVNPAGTRVYVSNYSSSNVSVIDTATNTVIATVPVTGGTPMGGLVVNPAGTRAYVASGGSGTGKVSVIDTATNSIIASVPGLSTGLLAINPMGTRIYATNPFSNSVSVIDTGTNTVVATVNVGAATQHITIDPLGGRVYVTSNGASRVTVINTATNTVVTNITVTGNPTGLAINPPGTRVYVTRTDADMVSIIDTATNTIVGTVPVGDNPVGAAVNAINTKVYVANFLSDNVSVIDIATNTVIATLPLGANTNPIDVAIARPPQAVCHFSLNQASFSPGSSIVAQTLDIVNPKPVDSYVEYKFWVELPGGGTYSWMHGGHDIPSNGSNWVLLPAGSTLNALGTPQTLVPTVTATYPGPGAYSLNCSLLDPVSGIPFVVDKTPFTVVP